MASENGGASPPLAQTLFDEAHRFDFFQAVRLLERLHRERTPVGRATADPALEVVRFRSHALLRFPPNDVVELGSDPADAGQQPQMVVNFMGLVGASGVLPYHYTEEIFRHHANDDALWDFLDLFTHRMVSLFYRAWERRNSHIGYERDQGDPFTAYLFALVGLGTEGLRERSKLPDGGKGILRYGGLVARQPRSSADVECVLSDFFGAPARVEQCTGQWLPLEDGALFRLGASSSSSLGANTFVGARVWDDQSKFRLRLGPLDLRQFVAFLPDGPAFKKAVELTRFLVGPEYDFDLELVVRADEAPGFSLKSREEPTRLGWTTWLKTGEHGEDPSATPSLDWKGPKDNV